MIEFNLLPDVKINYLRSKRLERLVISVSSIVGGLSLAIFILLLVLTDVTQKLTIHNLNNQITSSTSSLSTNKSLNQILTVQKQLQTLPTLEAQSPTVSRLFGYLSQLTPVNATISSLSVSFSANNVTIAGGADSLATVNTYVDTLKYATYNNLTTKTKGNQAFNTVVLASFDYSSSSGGASPAQYTITFNVDPALFDSSDNVSLVVPSEITTRSILDQAKPLFKAEPTKS